MPETTRATRPRKPRATTRKPSHVVAKGNGHLRKCWLCNHTRHVSLMRQMTRGLWKCASTCLPAR